MTQGGSNQRTGKGAIKPRAIVIGGSLGGLFDILLREVGAALRDIPELAELTRGDETWRTMR